LCSTRVLGREDFGGPEEVCDERGDGIRSGMPLEMRATDICGSGLLRSAV